MHEQLFPHPPCCDKSSLLSFVAVGQTNDLLHVTQSRIEYKKVWSCTDPVHFEPLIFFAALNVQVFYSPLL